ncbi:hypothetical protein KL921_001568 [Ogataea angusta]|uniref:Uncharacterized protein n=1 Tax=Pichia angusta TaxID=870730 RepID=A0AAN6DH43_PICAN|nr:uncharacterized protein KL928_002804 [Ogataea angusta]KAG7812336.1 hypothetical protein KL921_001568 [Ogataea angusta]KAG7818936.1 hypothetical protein KL928_002804 [Ogataea angusta]KAG7825183.1 hypothetical protein KL909_001475 [Ogataea angusta]KAG7830370.1 hypothetical protein KL920_002008 [Ogataea angusta]KAG7834499.1 hypothetical protein KL943_002883 [Ogataea angusta]
MWFRKSETTDDKLPEELQKYVDSKESTISDRQLKKLLAKQTDGREIGDDSKHRTDPNSYRLQQQSSKEAYRLEMYKREYPVSEAISINCAELFNKFLQCDRARNVWSSECVPLWKMVRECQRIQKEAFVTFDYEYMNKIEEMDAIRQTCDRLFTKHFKTPEDTDSHEKILQYSLDLKHERERFYERFGK